MTYVARFFGACLLLTAACATGTTTDDELSGGGAAGGFAEGGGGFGEGGFGNMGGGGFGEGGSGQGGMGGDPTTCGYDAPNVCMTAAEIPTVAGDKNGAPQVKSGNTSMWFEVLIEEQSSSVFEEDLSYTVTLDSPPGMHWDLVVRQGAQNGAPNCSATNKEGVPQGNSEVVTDSWDDDQGFGGEDDSTWLSIGVIYGSGDLCDEAATWTLSVQGHT